jgi:hypothetical protein
MRNGADRPAVLGPRWSEPGLPSPAYAFEQVTDERRAPRYRSSVGN